MRTLILLLFTVFFVQAQSQVTIESDGFFHTGSFATIANVGEAPPGFDPGTPGPDRVWDFSGFVMDTSYYMLFLDPAETPHGNEFPSANMAVNRVSYVDSAYFYAIRNDEEYTLVGMAGQFEQYNNVITHLTPPQIGIEFPVNYLDSIEQLCLFEFKIASTDPPVDSIWVRTWIDSHIKIDAWGTLTNPVGTYDVLRSKAVYDRIDSVWVLINSEWGLLEVDDGQRVEYAFMSDTEYYPVTEFASVGGGSYYGWFSYLLSFGPMPFISENQNELSLKIYPVPVSDELNASWTGMKSGKFVLFDLQGKQVLMKDFENTTEIRLNTSSLPEGFYLYEILFAGANDKVTGKLIVH